MAIDLGSLDIEHAIRECAREPIHTPGATQPFGFAIVADHGGRVTHVSRSVESHLGIAPEALLGARIQEVLAQALAPVWTRADTLGVDHLTNLSLAIAGSTFDVAVWRRDDGAVVLSLTPAAADPGGPLAEELSELQRGFARSQSPQEVFDRTSRSLADLSGYDRVMVYAFDAAGNGSVVSEAKQEGMEPFLGMHYPATDIPMQARALYLRNRTRVLADTRAAAEPLLAADEGGPPADLSMSLVRAHSAVHVQYLENMGVRATLTVSIVTDGKLWGLVACHHLTPRWPTTRTRLLAELLSEIIAVRIQLQEEAERHRADARARQAQHDILRLLATAGSSWADVIGSERAAPLLTELVTSAGAACISEEIVHLVGETPPVDVIRGLPAQFGPELVDEMFHASSVRHAGALAAHEDVASGVLAIRLRADGDSWLFWFRPAKARQVTWAGNPAKAVVVEAGVGRLSPRQSFAAWIEEQRGCADPWTTADLACARRIRESLIDMLLQLYASTVQAARVDLLGLRRACEAAGQPLAVLDANGSPTFSNSAWAALFGPRWAEEGSELASIFAEVRLRVALADVLAGRARTYVGESDLAGAVPSRVLVAIDGVWTDAGVPTGAVVVVTDLRERMRAEEDRRKSQERVAGADRMEALALVTGTVAHDFNNLLTGILCETALLTDDAEAGSPQREGLDQIERTARRAADLCKQLLTYSGKGTFVVRRTDLVALARDVVLVLGSIIPENITVVVRSSAPALHVVIDAIQIRQVLMNLIVNACDASDGSTAVPAEVELAIESSRLPRAAGQGGPTQTLLPGDYVVFRVRDHGIGIAEPVLRHIFEPFYSTKQSGRGLGLAAVLGIVRSHKGAVDVESKVGSGTSFSVWLPAAPEVVGEPASNGRRSALPGAPCVLVVEDEVAALRACRRILERAGYVVLASETVAAARAVLEDKANKVELVFTDLRLPDGSGRDVLIAAALRSPKLPVILTSGLNDGLEPLSAATPNLVAFVPKPYDRVQLLGAVANALRRDS